MAVKIFICYRREVSDDFARDIARRCTEKYGDTDVFYDRHSIQTSENWKRRSREIAAQADLFILIIGPNWLDCSDSSGTRRIDEIDDPVRLEIEAAMGGGSKILPIRHGNADMPRERDLPPALVGLDALNAFSITQEYHDRDVETLFPKINELLSAAEEHQRIEEIARREKLQRVAASAQKRAERFEHLLRARGLSNPLVSIKRQILKPYAAFSMLLFAAVAFAAGWTTHFVRHPDTTDLANKLAKIEMQLAAKAKCDRVGMSPKDIRAKKEGAGVDFEKLKVADVDACIRSLKLDPSDPAQMFQLGRLLGKAKRHKEALRWYAKAADQGNALAQYNIGLMYQQDNPIALGLPASDPLGCKDEYDCDARAVDWFAKAADKGNASAKVNLGLMFQNQRGVLQRQTSDPLGCKSANDCNTKAMSALR